jgi:hypothetical protein
MFFGEGSLRRRVGDKWLSGKGEGFDKVSRSFSSVQWRGES